MRSIVRLILTLAINVCIVCAFQKKFAQSSSRNVALSVKSALYLRRYGGELRYPRLNASPVCSFINSRKNNRCRNLPSSLHFKVSEADEEDMVEEIDEIQFDSGNRVGTLKRFSFAVIPLATTLGFALTPSAALALRIAGATAGGVAGIFARKLIVDRIKAIEDDMTDEIDNFGGGGNGRSIGPSPSVSAALKYVSTSGPPITSLSTKGLELIAKKFKVPEDELGSFFTHVFANIVYTSTKSVSTTGTSDLTQLLDVVDFSSNSGLTAAEIGDGFALAATKLGMEIERDESGFYAESFPIKLLHQAAYIFFLADKMMSTGFDGFYGRRLMVGLSYFTPESYEKFISHSCMKLFRRCVERVLIDPDSFSGREVSELRDFISTNSPSVSTFRPANMQNLVMEIIQASFDKNLQAGADDASVAMSASVENYDNLVKAQKILGWSGSEFDSTLEIRTLPTFERVVRSIIDDVVDRPEHADKYMGVLEERISSLKLDIRKARTIINNVMGEKNRDYMTSIDKVYSASKGLIDPAYKIMVSYSRAHGAVVSLVESIMDDSPVPLPGLPFADMVRANLYEAQLKNGASSSVAEGMFDLSSAQRDLVRKALALPKISSWINQCILENNFTEGAKAAYEKLLREYNILQNDWLKTAIDFYYQETSKISALSAVPSAADLQRLSDLRDFLGCSNSPSISKVNLEIFGDKYVKALTECMTPTGVIAEEYVDGLMRLRDRLGLSSSDAEALLSVASRMRMIPIIKSLQDQYLSDTDPKKKAEKAREVYESKSGDPISSLDNMLGYTSNSGAQKQGGGPNVFMREAINMIDFFEENYNTQGVDIKSLEKLPVTAVGIIPEKELIDLFKHYVVTRLSESDPELYYRYTANEDTFALALGLSAEGQAKVKESLAYSLSKNMLKSIIGYGNTVSPQDLKQLKVLKDRLALDQAVADEIFDDACKGALIEHAVSIIRPQESVITADTVQLFRTQVQSLGLEIKKDLGFNDRLISYLYALEVQSLVESDQVDQLRDVQEAYDIPEAQAELIVEAACKRYINQLLNLALRAAKKYDEKDCMFWTNQVVKYAMFVNGVVEADGNMFSEDDKTRLISFYEHSELVDANEEAKAEMAQKLKDLILLTEDYVSPIEGIEGLLGKTKNLNELMLADPKANKKRWAWG